MPDSPRWVLIRSGTVAGQFLIIDLSGDVPQLVSADQILPAVIVEQLAGINERLDRIIMTQAQYEADIAALQAFFTGLPAQLDAIRAAMSTAASSGVQDLSALDALAGQANAASAAVGSVVSSPATPDVPPDMSAPIDPVPVPSEQPPPDVVPPDAAPADTSGSTPDVSTDVPPDAPLPS